MNTAQTETVAACPECEAALTPPSDAMLGEILACDDCGAELEVLAVEPGLSLGLAPEVQEDWGE